MYMLKGERLAVQEVWAEDRFFKEPEKTPRNKVKQ